MKPMVGLLMQDQGSGCASAQDGGKHRSLNLGRGKDVCELRERSGSRSTRESAVRERKGDACRSALNSICGKSRGKKCRAGSRAFGGKV